VKALKALIAANKFRDRPDREFWKIDAIRHCWG
jgi:hypothetical protein